MILCLFALVSPEHGLLALQTDLVQLPELVVPNHLLSQDPGRVDEDEPHGGLDDAIGGRVGVVRGKLLAERFEGFRIGT